MKPGIGVTNAIAIGKAYVLQELDIKSLPTVATDVEGEVEKLLAAVETSRQQLADIAASANEETAEIMEAHITFLEDDSFNSDAAELIRQHSYTAVKAIDVTAKELFEMFSAMDDDYMRERASDINDVSSRVIRNILGEADNPLGNLPPNTIVVARDLVPSQTAQLDRNNVVGFVTELGGKTSHTAIMARAMGIAAIVGCKGVLDGIASGDDIIVNAISGEVFVSPSDVDLQTQTKLKEEHDRYMLMTETAKNWTLHKKDGGELLVCANIGNPEEAKTAKANGADGIGLFRSEFLYMDRNEMPSEEEQFQAYKSVAETFGEAPVIIRTLDIGGDKSLPYLDMPEEENPFLGVRAIRLCFKHEELFRTQLRALLRAGSFGNLKIMFPMISTMSELHRAKDILEECKQDLSARGISFNPYIKVGMMIEIPAAAIHASEFAKEVDFFSIGTNDLTQYTLAVDRGNAELDHLYDYLHPSVLWLIENTIKAAHAQGIECGMCGEMAGDPKALHALSYYGLDEYSVGLGNIGQTKCGLIMQEHVVCEQADEDFVKGLRA